jgi:DNA-directed RNA polymerase subunit RPC12/RpoP
LREERLYEETKCIYFEKGVNYRDLPRSKKWSRDDDNVYVHCPRCDAKKRMNLRLYLFEADRMEYYRCEECGKLFGVIEENE